MMKTIPPITRYLLLTNVVVYLVQLLCDQRGIDLADVLGLHFVLADRFGLWQLVSYMFLHGSLMHLFFNMFSLWMFGGIIERTLGTRRYLLYYLVCGVGAGLCQELWQTGQYLVEGLYRYEWVSDGLMRLSMADYLNAWTTIGASGACYGVLLAFGRLYPNERLMLLFPPIPMKAKYFVAGYAAIELVSAFATNGNIAHFAHLGGMLFGWGLLWLWHRQARRASCGVQWPPRREPLRVRLMRRLEALLHPGGKPAEPPTRPETDHEANLRRQAEEARMDEILDKVRRSGYDSLTKAEKDELFRISRR